MAHVSPCKSADSQVQSLHACIHKIFAVLIRRTHLCYCLMVMLGMLIKEAVFHAFLHRLCT